MNQKLAVIPAKITDVLVITPEIEGDLYNELSQKAITTKIELLGSLAFSDDQEAEMDETATAMNKFATTLDKLSAATYKKVTESASKNRDITKAQVTALKSHRTRIIYQFEAQKKAKLDAIKDILAAALAEAWAEKGVSINFRKADLPEPKKTMLTPAGALTSATKKVIDQLAQNDRNWELELNSRKMRVELECRRAGIDTPFSENYIGGVFYGQDKAAFESRLESLVQEELKRREDAKEKMRIELEAENQRKIDEALRNQEAENKRQREAEEAERKRQEIKPTLVVSQENHIIHASEYGLNPSVQVAQAPKQAEAVQENTQEQTYTGEVRITLSFVLPLKSPTTKTFLKGWFLNSLPEKVRNALTAFEVENV
jgi:hypothetical protein